MITEVAGLRPLLGLATVHVLGASFDGAAYLGFVFGCDWDAAHGVGVITHRSRVINTGLAEICLNNRQAVDDAMRQIETTGDQ